MSCMHVFKWQPYVEKTETVLETVVFKSMFFLLHFLCYVLYFACSCRNETLARQPFGASGSEAGQHHEIRYSGRQHYLQVDRLWRRARAWGRSAVHVALRHRRIPGELDFGQRIPHNKKDSVFEIYTQVQIISLLWIDRYLKQSEACFPRAEN